MEREKGEDRQIKTERERERIKIKWERKKKLIEKRKEEVNERQGEKRMMGEKGTEIRER